MGVTYQLFGTLAADDDQGPVDLGSTKQRRLLAILLLAEGQPVGSDLLIDRIWDGDPPTTARHSVQLYVSGLRKVLGADAIETVPTGYVLHTDPEAVDLHRFRAHVERALAAEHEGRPEAAIHEFEAALELCRGEPLNELRYDDFVQPTINRVGEERALAVEHLARLVAGRGEDDRSLRLAAELRAAHPLREAPVEIIMRSLHAKGRKVDALREYRSFAETLRTELGLDPSRELRLLEEEILLSDSSAAIIPTRNPYKGLAPFKETDAADFFGRQEATEALVARVCSLPPLVTVVGPSGVGKSSVVHAGLLPALRETPPFKDAMITSMTPGSDPFGRLRAALGTPTHHSVTEAFSAVIKRASRLILVIDQFEELATHTSPEVTNAFLSDLATATRTHSPQVTTVATLRADHYGLPLSQPDFAELFSGSTHDLTPLTPVGLEEAVRGPALNAGISVDPRLIPVLIADMGHASGGLAHFQHTLRELAARGELSVALYNDLGGMAAMLSSTADGVFEQLDPDGRQLARQMLLRMVSLNGTGIARRRVPVQELLDLNPDRALAHEVISLLTERRLLTADRDPATGEGQLMVAHEALLTGWNRLAGWIDDHTSDLRMATRLSSATREWAEHDRDPSFLLSGSRLTEFCEWEGQSPLALSRTEWELLDASATQEAKAAEAEVAAETQLVTLTTRVRTRSWWAAVAVLLFLASMTATALILRPDPTPRISALLVEPGGFFPSSVHTALEQFDDTGTFFVTDQSFGATLDQLLSGGTEVVITLSEWEHELALAAEASPETRFVLLDSPDLTGNGPPNLTRVEFCEEEASFLAGAIAASVSKTGHIGFIGGVEGPIIFAFQSGFEDGARFVDPAIEVSSVYLSSTPDLSGFHAAPLAGIIATNLFERGVDVVFPAAGNSGLGAFEAARRWKLGTGEHVWVLGVDVEMLDEFAAIEQGATEVGAPLAYYVQIDGWRDHLLTDVLKQMGEAASTIVSLYESGSLRSGTTTLGLAEGAVGLSNPLGRMDPFQALIDDLTAKIVSGEITVDRTPDWNYERAFEYPPEEAAFWTAFWQTTMDPPPEP